MAAKKVDTLKAKQKRQKMIAAVGCVILIAVLAFQVPRTMKMLHKGSPPPAPTVTAAPPAGTPSLAAPTLGGGGTTTPAATANLATAAPGPSATSGRLVSFGRFQSKDPFQPQVSGEATSSAATPVATPATSGTAVPAAIPAAAAVPSAPAAPAPTPGAAAPSGSTAPAPAPSSAVISVNGVLGTVSPGADFPQPSAAAPDVTPYFHLVSLTATTAKISIAGGSYATGARTVTLHVKKPLTLVNTADGTRYRILLMPQGTAVPAAGGASTTSP
jgi:hypothetical protein